MVASARFNFVESIVNVNRRKLFLNKATTMIYYKPFYISSRLFYVEGNLFL